ncbi:hypothetical protein BvCmsK56A_04145 [Escherichia coli]|nr:hypothetical protein BvCmsK56A_04145 [Escherichia coli]
MFIGKLNALWCTRHRAIVISQLTQHTSRFKACQRHQINSRFSMTATRQYTTCLRAKWENVARAIQIRRFCAIGNRCANGRNTISGRNTGSHTFSRFNGHGKTGAIGAGVIFYHHWQIKLFTAIFSDAQANNTATVANGQRHLLNGHGFCREDHIAFVFTVFIIKHHYTASFTQRSQCIFNTFERRTKRGK